MKSLGKRDNLHKHQTVFTLKKTLMEKQHQNFNHSILTLKKHNLLILNKENNGKHSLEMGQKIPTKAKHQKPKGKLLIFHKYTSKLIELYPCKIMSSILAQNTSLHKFAANRYVTCYL